MAHLLQVLDALTEDLGLIFSIHIRQLTLLSQKVPTGDRTRN